MKKLLYVAILFSMSLPACTSVAPWQRGKLAQPQMAVDPIPLHRVYREHIFNSREGLMNIGVFQGGGCGCY